MTTSTTGMKQADKPDRNRAGFTLIELMFAAFILLILAGFSASLFRRSYGAISRDLAVRDVLNLMGFARARAVMERTDYGIRFTPVENRYWLVRRAEGLSGEFGRVAGQWGNVRRLPRGLEWIGEERVVVFYPDGTASPVSLQVASQEARVELQVDPVTGGGRVREEF